MDAQFVKRMNESWTVNSLTQRINIEVVEQTEKNSYELQFFVCNPQSWYQSKRKKIIFLFNITTCFGLYRTILRFKNSFKSTLKYKCSIMGVIPLTRKVPVHAKLTNFNSVNDSLWITHLLVHFELSVFLKESVYLTIA